MEDICTIAAKFDDVGDQHKAAEPGLAFKVLEAAYMTGMGYLIFRRMMLPAGKDENGQCRSCPDGGTTAVQLIV